MEKIYVKKNLTKNISALDVCEDKEKKLSNKLNTFIERMQLFQNKNADQIDSLKSFHKRTFEDNLLSFEEIIRKDIEINGGESNDKCFYDERHYFY